MRLFIIVLIISFIGGCKTLDMENVARNQSGSAISLGKDGNPLSERELKELKEKENAEEENWLIENTVLELEPEIVVVEKPFYVPEKEVKGPEKKGQPAVAEATASGIKSPKDYSYAAIIYDYHPDWVYEVYTQPLRTTDIYLEVGEQILDLPFISDSERWILGGGVSNSFGEERQHIYIKPSASALEASLIINTDRRVYHLALKSFRDSYMPIVRWQYKLSGFPKNFIKPAPENERKNPVTIKQEMESVDPRFLSFDYKVTYGIFRKPAWFPRLVYDDGKKTYIAFDERVLQNELPAIFENRADIVNYRVSGNLIIIDKLIKKITVRLKTDKISIEKKE
ncbi:MAG: TrbG/VirB9 family P-type conjugative transfer protein [Spirochaetaceae bacterium]|jgi:type IV secretion system protein VirB9|nr:TrbG/VirB9 family P-type conjugative transfer protein [Spirochaetaceae bacterium]